MPCEFNLRQLAVSFIINLFAYSCSSFQVNLHSIIYKHFQKQLQLKIKKKKKSWLPPFQLWQKNESLRWSLVLMGRTWNCGRFLWPVTSFREVDPAAWFLLHPIPITLLQSFSKLLESVKTCLDDFRNSFLLSDSICYYIGSI